MNTGFIKYIPVVFGSFVLHLIMIGTTQSFGIIFSELLLHFDQGKAVTTWIPSINLGVSMLSGPIAGALTAKTGCRVATILGSIIAAVGMASSMFVNSLYLLYLTYGLITGFGFGMLNITKMAVINLHFDKRRSLAMGIASCGTGVGSMTLPYLFQFAINTYGWRGTFLVMSGVCLQGVVFGAMFTSNVIKTTELEDPEENSNNLQCGKVMHLLINPPFVIFTLSGCLVAMVLILPFVVLPDLLKEKGFSSDQAAFVLTVSGISSLVCRIVIGLLSDVERVNRCILYGVIMIIGGTATASSGHLETFNLFCLYAVILGPFTGSFSVLQPVITQDLVGRDVISLAFGFLSFFQGFLISIGTPIGGWITDYTGNYTEALYFGGAAFSTGGILLLCIPVVMKYRNNMEYTIEQKNISKGSTYTTERCIRI